MISSRGLFMCFIYIPFARLYTLPWPMKNLPNPANPASIHYRDKLDERHGVTLQMASLFQAKVPISPME